MENKNRKVFFLVHFRSYLGLAALVLASLACSFLWQTSQPTSEPGGPQPGPKTSITDEALQPLPGSTQLPPTANVYGPLIPVNPAGITGTLTPALPLPTTAPAIPVTPLAEPPLPAYWGLIPAQDGLWVIQPDGFGLHRVINERMNTSSDLQTGAAPEGGLLAFVSSDSDAYTNLALKLLHLPEGTLQTITPLLPANTSEKSVQPDGPLFEAARAIRDLPALAWSPDGKDLAFISAHDGSSADVYTYDRSNGKIAHLTKGPSQAYAPAWSPDGKQIVHFGATSFGTGAGYTLAGAWVVDQQGNVTDLYKPESQNEKVVGWLSPDIFLVNSWHTSCGDRYLRSLSISNRDSSARWPASFSSLAFDPSSKVITIGVDQYTAQCDPTNQPGSYLLDATGTSHRISEKAAQQVIWSQAGGVFILRAGGHPVFITPDGQEAPAASTLPLQPQANPDGQVWAWPGGPLDSLQGLWIGRLDETPRQVFDTPVWGLSWEPDGKALFFFSLDGLYIARGPEYSPQAVSSTLLPADNARIIWLKR